MDLVDLGRQTSQWPSYRMRPPHRQRSSFRLQKRGPERPSHFTRIPQLPRPSLHRLLSAPHFERPRVASSQRNKRTLDDGKARSQFTPQALPKSFTHPHHHSERPSSSQKCDLPRRSLDRPHPNTGCHHSKFMIGPSAFGVHTHFHERTF